MSGRGGRNSHIGRGNGHSGRGRGIGQNCSGAGIGTGKRGLCSALGGHVFDYGQKAATDQMRTLWDKLVQYMGTTYGADISNELQNKTTVVLAEPSHDPIVIAHHMTYETMVRAGQVNIRNVRVLQRATLQSAITTGGADPDAPLKLAILQNEIAQGDFDALERVSVQLTEAKKMLNSSPWRTYCKRNASLLKHQG